MAADTKFHHRIPIVGRPFVQRNEARLQRDQARRELARVGAERDEARRERDEALDNLARHKLDTSILDSYINEAPSHQAAFRVFEGEWSSNVPGYGCGSIRRQSHQVYCGTVRRFSRETCFRTGPA
jgi:hypothetical protein